ncbi:MAG: PAS domain S-box protein [Rhodocyclaceae bacterium]|nr:PAS domain S-box protein [Rhodocyclaceae bacterium]
MPVGTPLPSLPSPRWLWLLPRLSFVFFIAAVSLLLWLYNRSEAENQRMTLISDMLWLEQDLQFQLTHNAELLGQFSPRQVSDRNSFAAAARSVLDGGLRRVRWLDRTGQLRLAYPEADTTVTPDAYLRLAHTRGKAIYGAAYENTGWWVDVYVPVFHRGGFSGTLVASYSLQQLLEKSLPWWLVERYRIVIVNAGGRELAARSQVAAPNEESSYQMAFDPPGSGLYLRATPYRSPLPPVGPLLSAALVLLALTVLWSLWALRRQERQRLAAEHALRQEHAFRKAMEDSVQTGLRARDLEGRITYVNPAFCRMVGWSEAELVGQAPPMPYWMDEDLEATRALHDRILAGEGPTQGFEIRFKRRSGEAFTALIHEAPLIDANGRHVGWMSSIIDVSEQKKAEELARQQQERLQTTARLVTMGEMASSLAHELNQPLAAIASYNTGCLNLIASGEGDLKEIGAVLAKSAEQAQRAGRIIRRIYEFVRRAEPKAEPLDLEVLLGEVLGFVEADARSRGIRIERRIAGDLPVLTGDRVLLSQALLNLIRNGMDAMRDQPGPRRILHVEAAAEDSGIHLRIADQGTGIRPETAGQLFEPLFTTKPEGMGMGLNICRSVVEGHQGRLWHEPNPGGGSIFHVTLPVAVA